MRKQKKLTGFYYYVDDEKIKEYKKMPLELRLNWLYQLNKLRKYYPKDIIRKHEEFRKGKNIYR